MLTPQDAASFLADVPKDKTFRTYLGPEIENLYGLADALETISNDSFNHHVTSQKNDFANWIRDVIKDEELANSVATIKNSTAMARIVKKRIDALERIKLEGYTVVKERFVSGVIDFIIGIVVGFIIGIIIAFFFR